MSRRGGVCRAAGAVMILLGVAPSAVGQPAELGLGATLPLIGFGVAIIGIMFVVQGRRVVQVFRIERSRHRDLPFAINARRRRDGH